MWLSLFQRFILRDIRHNPLRGLLTVSGIGLGVAIWLAIHLANQTVLGRFADSVERVAGRTNLQIVANGQPDFPESLLSRIQPLWDVHAEITPVIAQTALWPEGNREVIQVQGMDMLTDSGVRDYAWQPGGEPADYLDIFKPNQVFVGYQLAKTYQLKRGQAIRLLVNDGVQMFHIAGILSEKGLGGAYSGNTIYMDIGTAQLAFAMAGRINRVDLVIPKMDMQQAQSRLRAQLPAYMSLQRPTRNSQQVEQMLRAFQTNLTTLSFISLMVGMFLIYNTMSIAVIRRRPEIGTLRALGIGRKTIAALFVAEAAVFGLLGSCFGLLLGAILSQGAVQGVSLTVQTLYLGYPVSGVILEPASLVLAFCLGIGLAVLAALPPVIEAAGIPPAEATRKAAYESRIMRLSGRIAIVGLALGVIAVMASFQPPVMDFPIFGYLAALLTILSTALLLPWFLQRLLPVVGRLFYRLMGTEGQLSATLLYGALGRTSVAIASLTIGIAMMVSLSIMIGSFRQTVITWVNQTLKADLWIEPASRLNSRQTGRISQPVIRRIHQAPGVEAVDPFLEFPIEYNGRPAYIGVGNMETLATRGHLTFLDGADSGERVREVLASSVPAGLITETFAIRHQVNQGDTITLTTPNGPLSVRIMGVYYDYSSEQGYLIIDRSLYHRYYGPGGATQVAVFIAPNADAEQVRRNIYSAVGAQTRLTMRTNKELRAEVLRIFDSTFAITYALHTIAIVVAILGIMNTLFALVVESRREFGILKYLGASSKQIQKIVLMQAGLLGFLGNLMGLGVGFLLALLLILVINKQSFGWTVQFSMPWDFLIQSFALVLVTSALSGLIPARLASRTLAPEVVRAE